MIMNNQPTILFPVDPTELLEQIRLLIRTELDKTKQTQQAVSYQTPGLTQKPVYKAFEVCAMLNISRQTLHTWVKDGIIKAYKVRSRVFFLQADIDKLLFETTGK
jgi:excisionase family DNA binding protein